MKCDDERIWKICSNCDFVQNIFEHPVYVATIYGTVTEKWAGRGVVQRQLERGEGVLTVIKVCFYPARHQILADPSLFILRSAAY